ncbi:MAG: DUF1697 domain-containing protein [Flavobacteriaceae bacterium]
MNTYIAFLRGINVGGQKKFPKAHQLELLSAMKLEEPQVYLHTGNWIFKSNESKAVLEAKLLKAIEKRQGWQAPILLKTASEIAEIVKECPFREQEKVKSYFILLFEPPSVERAEAVEAISFEGEKFVLTPQCVYLYSAVGYGNAKLNNNFFEGKLKLNATTRNFNTLTALIGMTKNNT